MSASRILNKPNGKSCEKQCRQPIEKENSAAPLRFRAQICCCRQELRKAQKNLAAENKRIITAIRIDVSCLQGRGKQQMWAVHLFFGLRSDFRSRAESAACRLLRRVSPKSPLAPAISLQDDRRAYIKPKRI
jgi:hypothetical protein